MTTRHLLIARAGHSPGSRYTVLVGLVVEDPNVVAERLAAASAESVIEALRELASHVRICFARTQKLEALGGDWVYFFLTDVSRGYYGEDQTLIVHVHDDLSQDLEWLGKYLGAIRHRLFPRFLVRRVAASEACLALVEYVARIFHEAIEDDPDRPSLARARYERISTLVEKVDDVGRKVSYGRGFFNDLVRLSLRD